MEIFMEQIVKFYYNQVQSEFYKTIKSLKLFGNVNQF